MQQNGYNYCTITGHAEVRPRNILW